MSDTTSTADAGTSFNTSGVSSEGGDDVPPAWMTEDPKWADSFNDEASAWEDEPLLTDADITPELIAPSPNNASHLPHFVDGDAEDFEIFYPDKMKPFAEAKNAALQQSALAAKSKAAK